MLNNLGLWDVLLITVVPIHATATAYLYKPKHKALLLCLPIPFTLAVLAVGKEMDAANVTGIILYAGFCYAVYLLHKVAKLPIVASIALSALAYGISGSLLLPFVERTETFFWGAAAACFSVALVLYLTIPFKDEPGHKSPLPVWIKFIAIAAVLGCLVAAKSLLAGFVTAFPMVTVITAYEARHSLWTTLCRQASVAMMVFLTMVVSLHISQPHLGWGPAFIIAWLCSAVVFMLFNRKMWAADEVK
ncbi:MAG: hypothetical protein ACYTFY_04555 [Planctomycetota bacterium]|jgi:hypothetical protein